MNCPINSERWNRLWRLEQRKSVKNSIFIIIFLNIFQLKRQTLSNLKPHSTSPEFSYEWRNSVKFFSISDCTQKSKYIWIFCPAFNYKRHLENSDKYLNSIFSEMDKIPCTYFSFLTCLFRTWPFSRLSVLIFSSGDDPCLRVFQASVSVVNLFSGHRK